MILVAGGTGMLGRLLIPLLAAHGDPVRILTRATGPDHAQASPVSNSSPAMSATPRRSGGRWPASGPSSRRSTGSVAVTRSASRDRSRRQCHADRRRRPSRRRTRCPGLDPRRVDRPSHRALPDEGRGRGPSQGIGPVLDDRPTDRVPGDLAGDRRTAAGRRPERRGSSDAGRTRSISSRPTTSRESSPWRRRSHLARRDPSTSRDRRT